MDGLMQFPEEMRGEVIISQVRGRTIKETDSDWQLGEQWEQQYFIVKKDKVYNHAIKEN